MRLRNYFALTTLFLSLCLTKGDDIKKTTVSWNPNDFLDELLQKRSYQEYIELAEKYNLNITFIYEKPTGAYEHDAIEIFYNNGQTDREKELNVKEFTTDDFEKLVKKARDNGMEAYISQEKYNDDAVPVREYFYADNQELDFKRNSLHDTFKMHTGATHIATIPNMYEHNIRVYNLTYSNTGELDQTLQYDIIQPTIKAVSDLKDSNPTYLFSVKMLLNSIIKNILVDREHRAERLLELLDVSSTIEYYWEVIVNPTNYYSSYDMKIALKANDVEYHCLRHKF